MICNQTLQNKMEELQEFCESGDLDVYARLPQEVRDQLIKGSFQLLFQGNGNLELARNILTNEGLIQILIDKDELGAKSHITALTYRGIEYSKGLPEHEKLTVNGTAVYRVYSDEELQHIEEDFDDAYRSFPEYQRSLDNPNVTSGGDPICYVVGGFAAAGNPASFHNLFVRELRGKAAAALRELVLTPMMGNMLDSDLKKTLRVTTMPDRMMNRAAMLTPTPEAWHRDVAASFANVSPLAVVLGGWVNTSNHDQYFSTVPGSHLGVRFADLERGFAEPGSNIESQLKTLTKKAKKLVKGSDEYNELKEQMLEPKAKLRYMRGILKAHKTRTRIPPGHAISFPQYILHEIVANPVDHAIKRVFNGYTLDVLTDPIWDLRERMKNQAVLPLGSGQEPPMYSKSHLSYYQTKPFYLFGKRNPQHGEGSPDPVQMNLQEWSAANFKQVCIDPKTIHRERPIIYRYLPSLRALELDMYPEYTDEELKLYEPTLVSPPVKRAEPIVFTVTTYNILTGGKPWSGLSEYEAETTGRPHALWKKRRELVVSAVIDSDVIMLNEATESSTGLCRHANRIHNRLL